MQTSYGAFLFLLVSLVFSQRSASSAELRLLALTGQEAPGLLEPHFFHSSGGTPPTVNALGQVGFRQILETPFIDGYWQQSDNEPQVVAFRGMQGPAIPPGETWGFGGLKQNRLGHTAISGGQLEGDVDAIFTDRSGQLQRIVTSGEPAPGHPDGSLFQRIELSAFTGLSNLAIQGSFKVGEIEDPGEPGEFIDVIEQGIWIENQGSLSMIAYTGQPAPGAVQMTTFGDFFRSIRMNDANQLVFLNENKTNGSSAWFFDGSNLHLIGERGQSVQALPGANYGSLREVSLNATGEVVLATEVAGSETGVALFVGDPTDLSLVARPGDLAPGTSGTYRDFTDVGINSQGEVLFSADLNELPASGQGLWSQGGGQLHLVAKTEGSFPGLEGDEHVRLMIYPVLNDSGQTAFLGYITPTLNGGPNRGIWIERSPGDLDLIVRSGQMLEVAPGDFREVSEVYFGYMSDTGSGQSVPLNERGDVAFAVSFSDGTYGTFVAVPEPSSLLLVALGLPLVVWGRSKRVSHRRRSRAADQQTNS